MKRYRPARFNNRKKVSNPWREAIEGMSRMILKHQKLFPILGGRLLKSKHANLRRRSRNVSNPWREAIEGKPGVVYMNGYTCFQSLEGGY